MSYVYQYVSLPRLKAVLDVESLDTTDDTELQDKIEAAGQMINEYTHRIFVTVSETRTFNAPAETLLSVPDLLPSPTPTVTLNGTTLVAGTDYRLQPHTLTGLQPAYTGLVRLQSGFVARWGYSTQRPAVVSVPVSRWGEEWAGSALPTLPYAAYSPTPSEGIVTVAGAWGYGSAVPAAVALAAEILAARLWAQRTRRYADLAADANGNALPQHGPLLTKDVADLLAPYVRTAIGEATDA